MKRTVLLALLAALICLSLIGCSAVPSLKKAADMELSEITAQLNGVARADIHEAWGEPQAKVKLHGDIYAVDAENCFIVYYDSLDQVNSIMRVPGAPEMFAVAPDETTAAEETTAAAAN